MIPFIVNKIGWVGNGLGELPGGHGQSRGDWEAMVVALTILC